jgi:hypothetical protein
MKTAALLLMYMNVSLAALAQEKIPVEVSQFINERNICEHFLDEPYEGDTPEMIERKEFIQESIEIYCAGTDRRLAALRKRYKNNPAVINRLQRYADKIEAN